MNILWILSEEQKAAIQLTTMRMSIVWNLLHESSHWRHSLNSSWINEFVFIIINCMSKWQVRFFVCAFSQSVSVGLFESWIFFFFAHSMCQSPIQRVKPKCFFPWWCHVNKGSPASYIPWWNGKKNNYYIYPKDWVYAYDECKGGSGWAPDLIQLLIL